LETTIVQKKQTLYKTIYMIRRINKVAVLGSGVMGSGIACHFANIGVEVLLIDIVPRELSDDEKSKGLRLDDKLVRKPHRQYGPGDSPQIKAIAHLQAKLCEPD
jgi:3-hydroxyacyl-CoA dehydrogenase